MSMSFEQQKLALYDALASLKGVSTIERCLLLNLVAEMEDAHFSTVKLGTLEAMIGMDVIVVKRALNNLVKLNFVNITRNPANPDTLRFIIGDTLMQVVRKKHSVAKREDSSEECLDAIVTEIVAHNTSHGVSQKSSNEHPVFSRSGSSLPGGDRRFPMHENWYPSNIECYRTLLRLQRIPIDAVTEQMYQNALGDVISRYIVQLDRFNTDAQWTRLLVLQIAGDMERNRSRGYQSVRSKVSDALMNVDDTNY